MNDPFYAFRRLYQVTDLKQVYDVGERTPYPIIIEQPTFKDTFYNMGLSDWMPFLVSLPLGTVVSYYITHSLYEMPTIRIKAFGGFLLMVTFSSFYIGLRLSFNRLLGFEDNGLRWKNPEERVKKYVFTDDIHGFWEDLVRSDKFKNK